MTRSEQLAETMLSIAKVNHYMVGLMETVTDEERNAATQILITRQNDTPEGSKMYWRLDLALDLLDQMARDARERLNHENSNQ